MATAQVDEVQSGKVFFCHMCAREVQPTQDITCSICDSGAIEEIHANSSNATENEEETADMFASFWDTMNRDRRRRGHNYGMRQQSNTTGMRRMPQSQVLFHFGGGGPNGSFQFGTSSSSGDPFDWRFIQQLFGNMGVQLVRNEFVTGGNGEGFGVGGSFGDYAWGPNGLDNVITQLLNQLENTGPPPADKGKIEALPIYEITQKDLDERADCAVCQDAFELGETVKQLPCKHNFHEPCIDPWLELHDSCPICRCNLNGQTPRDDS